jgi:hypothetical protein
LLEIVVGKSNIHSLEMLHLGTTDTISVKRIFSNSSGSGMCCLNLPLFN